MMRIRNIWIALLIGVAAYSGAILICGCGGLSQGSYQNGGEFGATQGGVQDMTLARELVAQGQVPPAEALIVEAMFSEHDLPLEGAPCADLLCLRAELGVAPAADGASSQGWLQIGMSSTINPDTFVRPSISVVATVDVSGSMGWSYSNDSSPGALSKQLLHEIVDQLDSGDRFAMVTFGSDARIVLDWKEGDDQNRIHNAIDDLHENGSTDMESGMRKAYPLAGEMIGVTDQVRVMVLSDYQPNVNATEPTEFQRIARQGADDGVGLTLFGLGLGLGPDIMKAMSEIRGGNAFSAMDGDDANHVMEDSWPWMVSPIAYDLTVSVAPSEGLSIAETYGFPGADAQTGEASLKVATVFLSKRKGALLLQLVPESGSVEAGMGAQLHLTYQTLDGEIKGTALGASFGGQPLDERGVYMPQVGVGKTVALALLVSGMKAAAEKYGTDRDAAIAIMQATMARFTADAEAIADPALDAEVGFGNAMLDLMRAGATQGNFYPSYY